jgi:TonB family protein
MVKLYQERKYDEALPLAKRAVQLREAALGADDPLLRKSLINLAEIYLALRKFGDAQSPLERVVKSYEKTDPVAPQLAKVLESLALVHYARGNWSKSERAYQRALEVTEKAFGPDSSPTANAVLHLAEFYQFSGNYKKGEPLYQRLVSIQERGSGPAQREQLALAVDRYACLLRKTNRGADAKELEDRTLGPPRQSSQGNPDDAAALGNVLNGRAISLPRPSYPAEARAAGASGTVTVRVVIDETGKVVRACAISGPPLLIRESELAAYRAKFSPTKLSGMPVKVLGVITYKYVRQ